MAGKEQPDQLEIMREMRDLVVEQTDMARERTRLARERTAMSAERSKLSAERSYHNVERTLSVWVRTALALMVLGIAIDRFSLILSEHAPSRSVFANDLSTLTGTALVAFGVLVALIAGIRYLLYVSDWRRNHTFPYRHGPYLAPFFAFATVLFGLVLLLMLLFLL